MDLWLCQLHDMHLGCHRIGLERIQEYTDNPSGNRSTVVRSSAGNAPARSVHEFQGRTSGLYIFTARSIEGADRSKTDPSYSTRSARGEASRRAPVSLSIHSGAIHGCCRI